MICIAITGLTRKGSTVKKPYMLHVNNMVQPGLLQSSSLTGFFVQALSAMCLQQSSLAAGAAVTIPVKVDSKKIQAINKTAKNFIDQISVI